MAAEGVTALRTAGGEYRVEVRRAETTTTHRVLFSPELLDQLNVAAPDEERFVVESIRYLLEQAPAAALPQEIDLDGLPHEDIGYLPHVRRRMVVG